MSGVSVRQLADLVGVEIVVAPSEQALQRLIRSVHVTDLPEPGRYLLPSELIATNGLWLRAVPSARWIARIADAGASALAFGLSEETPTVPADVVAGCERAGLPLLAVGLELSFTSLTDALAGRLADDAANDLRLELGKTRRLLQASVDADAYSALAGHLRFEAGLSSSFVSPDGEILAAAGKRPRAVDILAATQAAREHQLPASTGSGSAFPVPSPSGRGSVLLVGAALQDITDAQRLTIEQTAAYAVVADQRRSERAAVAEVLTRELLDLLEDGDLGDRQLRARLATLGLRHEAIALTIVGDDTLALRNALGSIDARSAIASRAGRIEALVQGDDSSALIEELIGLTALWGVAAPFGYDLAELTPAALRVAFAASRTAHLRARGSDGRPLRATADSTQVLLAAIDPELRRAHANAVLGPVAAWDAAHRTNLLETLRVFLAVDGRWSEAAAALGIHVNTLKHRLARVATLSGHSVDRTADRVELWIALSLHAQAEPGRLGDSPKPSG